MTWRHPPVAFPQILKRTAPRRRQHRCLPVGRLRVFTYHQKNESGADRSNPYVRRLEVARHRQPSAFSMTPDTGRSDRDKTSRPRASYESDTIKCLTKMQL